jgi:hypothetical protein
MKPPLQGIDQAAAEASKTRLQSAMQGLGTTPGAVAPTRAQIGAAGAEAVQQQAQAVQKAQQTKLQLQEGQNREQQAQAALGQREALNQRRAALQTSLRKAEDTLVKLGMTTKQDLFDSSVRFEQDELGRTVFNERQLLDYAVTHAKDVEAMQNYEQAISQLSERKLRLMQVAQQKIQQELINANTAEQSALNQEAKLALARAQSAAKEKAAKEKAKAQNRASMWSALGGIAGAALGSFAGPGGATLGYSIGSGLGGVASTVE